MLKLVLFLQPLWSDGQLGQDSQLWREIQPAGSLWQAILTSELSTRPAGSTLTLVNSVNSVNSSALDVPRPNMAMCQSFVVETCWNWKMAAQWFAKALAIKLWPLEDENEVFQSFFCVFQVFHLSLLGELVPVNVWKRRSSRDVYTGNEKKLTWQLHCSYIVAVCCGISWVSHGFPCLGPGNLDVTWGILVCRHDGYRTDLPYEAGRPDPQTTTEYSNFSHIFEMPNSAITTFITSPDCSPLKNAGGFGGANHHFLRRFNQDSNLGRSKPCRLMVTLGASLVWFSMAAVNFRDLWAVFSGVSLAIIVHHEVTKVLIMMSGIVCVSCSDHYYNIHSYYYFFN